MARQIKELKQFNKGIISSASLQDIPDDACAFSMNIEPTTYAGVLRGVANDVTLFPKTHQSLYSLFPLVTKMEMIDLGETEDLVMFAKQQYGSAAGTYGLSYIRDWYGIQELGMSWSPCISSTVPCFAQRNKKFHIGFGAKPGDSYPKFLGYVTHKQWGERVSSSMILEDAALKSPDHDNGVWGLDKIIQIETAFEGSYEYDTEAVSDQYTTHFTRPNYKDGVETAETLTGHKEHYTRYHEHICSDNWLYGCRRGTSFLYKIKTENQDATEAHSSVSHNVYYTANGRHVDKDEGELIKSNLIVDSQNVPITIASIAPSIRYKNCLWATSALARDNRIFLINVNDAQNINDPDGALGDGNTWEFDQDTTVLTEFVINMPNIATPNETSTEEIPAGDWLYSDICETWECEPTDNADQVPGTGGTFNYWSNVDPNGLKYEGATGKILTNRLWITLYKPDGFEFALYNMVTIEPFVYSCDLMGLPIDQPGGVLNFINMTTPLRRVSVLNTTYDDDPMPIGYIPELWEFKEPEEGAIGHSGKSGYDEWKFTGDETALMGDESTSWYDADDYQGLSSDQNALSFGWNIGISDAPNVYVKIPRYPLCWVKGRASAELYDGIDGGHFTYDNYDYKTHDADIHQMMILCESNGDWVYEAGMLFPMAIASADDTWIGSNPMKTIPLNKFMMLCGYKYLGEGYKQRYQRQGNYHAQAPNEHFIGMLGNTDWNFHCESLSFLHNKVLFRMQTPTDSFFNELELKNVKSIVPYYNVAANEEGTYGQMQIHISEGYNGNEEQDLTLDSTRIWSIKIIQGEYLTPGEPSVDNTGDRQGELSRLWGIDPSMLNVSVPPLLLLPFGAGTIYACQNNQFPLSFASSFGNTINQPNDMVLFIAGTIGEYKNGVIIGAIDPVGAGANYSNEDGWWWSVTDDDVSAGPYKLASGQEWTAMEYPVPVNAEGTPLYDVNINSDSGYDGTMITVFEDDDATLIFDNRAVTSEANPTFDYTEGQQGHITEYKMSYIYDGHQYSPLTQTTWTNVMQPPKGISGTTTNLDSTGPNAVLESVEPHGLISGDTVEISSASDSRYDGEYVITILNHRYFKFTTSESDLDDDTNANWAFVPDDANTGCTEVAIEINLDKDLVPKRVTSLMLWAREGTQPGVLQDNFKLVGENKLSTGWSASEIVGKGIVRSFMVDRGIKTVGESFTASSNFPETLASMEIKYTLSVTLNDYHFVANCWHPEQDDLSYFMFRSDLERFDTFDWSNWWIKLPNIPTALAAFNNTIWVFDRHNMYRIDPYQFVLLDTFEGIGCCGPEAICITEWGMCFADMNNIYLHDGNKPTIIGQPIATSKEPKFGMDNINLGTDTKITFDQERGAFGIIVNKGKTGQYTEGGEVAYNYSGAPYIGYYHTDADDQMWTKAFHAIDSIKLRYLTSDENEIWNANNDN